MNETTTPPDAAGARREAASSLPLLGWITVAVVDVIVIAFRIPTRLPIPTRALTHFYDAFHLVAMGLAASGIVALVRRFGPRSRLARYSLLAAASAAVSYPILAEDVTGIAEKLPRVVSLTAWIALLAAVLAQAIPLAALLASLLARPWVRLVGVAGGVTLTVVNGINYPLSYQGVHLLGGVVCAILVGRSLRGSQVLELFEPSSPRVRTTITGMAALASAVSVTVWPGNAVALLVSRQPSAVLVPFLARLRSDEYGAHVVPEDQKEWFVDRAGFPPVPPSAPSLLPEGPIVILIGIDSMRGELLADERYRTTLPEIFRLRDEGTYFPDARAAGSSTGPSLAALFSGVYYSQLYWTRTTEPLRDDGLVYPHLDKAPRFPELLSAAGVRTITYEGAGWLLNGYGIVRGFAEEESFRRGAYPPASRLVTRAIERLKKHEGGPLFLFMHFLDAHSPYTSAGKKASPFEGYVAELGIVDREIKRLNRALAEAKLSDRTCMIYFADHGEAFGEHGLTWHANSLYDELLRVPLVLHPPGGTPRVVKERVSLVDLGPTILDLMGVPTPGHYMGQSLVGFLRGETPKLRRPIVAEARLKRAMVLPDGLKVIHDPRVHAVEIFDLNRDPREDLNLYHEGEASSSERFGALNAFFRAQTLKRPHYKVPYRKW